MKVGKPKIIREDGQPYIAFPALDMLLARQTVAKLGAKKDQQFELTVTAVKKKRSQDQNELMWKLCQMIAESIRSTKEEIYREQIRSYGTWTSVLVREDASADFARQWQSNGTGWVTEITERRPPFVVLRCYPGSSTYTVEQMKRLIDALMDECRALGIETDERIASLYAQN